MKFLTNYRRLARVSLSLWLACSIVSSTGCGTCPRPQPLPPQIVIQRVPCAERPSRALLTRMQAAAKIRFEAVDGRIWLAVEQAAALHSLLAEIINYLLRMQTLCFEDGQTPAPAPM